MIVFMLRHADRKLTDALSEDGIKRARLLARMLAESGVRAAFRSDTIRARDTLQPLNDVLGANLAVEPVHLVETAVGAKDHARRVIDAVTQLPPDATAVVVGHTTTVGPTIKGLTGQTIGTIEDQQFDKLFVLSIPAAGAATVTLLRYGAPT